MVKFKIRMKPVIVHGGGPQIGNELAKAGVESEFIGGLRVTTKSAMTVVKKVLGTNINNEIVKLIKKFGGNAISFNHSKYQIIRASKEVSQGSIDLGYVGKVDKIKTRDIKKIIEKGFIPVIAPIGVSRENNYLNINADVVTVSGKCDGQVSSDIISIKSTGKISGEVFYENISIEEGAVVEAQVGKRKN